MKVQGIRMLGSARPRCLGGPAWTQPKCCQASPSRASLFGLKASSVQSGCAQLTPPSCDAEPWGSCARANTAAGLLPAASGTAWVALDLVSLRS